MKKHLLAGLALVGALVAAPASATVTVGDTVTCGGANLECSVLTATVGAGAEFGIDTGSSGNLLNADFSSGLLTISFTSNPDFVDGVFFKGVYSLFFSNDTDPFTFAELGDVNGVYNSDGVDAFAFDPDNVSIDGGSVNVNLSNSVFTPGSSLQVKFDRTTTPPTDGAVPEPATWAMMILGFGLVGAAMRKRASATVQPLFA